MNRWLLLLVLTIAGCYQVIGYAPNYKQFDPPTDDRATVLVQWVQDVDEIHKVCPYKAIVVGCAVPLNLPPAGSGGVALWKIYAQKPKDFNDGGRLAVLGHEFFHTLGADHERPPTP